VPVWLREAGYKDMGDLRLDLARSRVVRQVIREVTAEAEAALAAIESDEAEQ
jgi:hypothetical protein